MLPPPTVPAARHTFSVWGQSPNHPPTYPRILLCPQLDSLWLSQHGLGYVYLALSLSHISNVALRYSWPGLWLLLSLFFLPCHLGLLASLWPCPLPTYLNLRGFLSPVLQPVPWLLQLPSCRGQCSNCRGTGTPQPVSPEQFPGPQASWGLEQWFSEIFWAMGSSLQMKFNAEVL